MSDEITPKVKRKYKKSTIIKEGQDKPKAAKARHYVNNKDFYAAMKARRELYNEWVANGKIGKKPQISDYIGECIMKIAQNLASKYQFTNYRFKDEMILDAIEHCLRYIDSFDPEKTQNPFSYYTQTCYFQFLSRIRTEKIQQYVKYKSTLSSAILGDAAEMNEYASLDSEHSLDNLLLETEFMDKFVEDFENKLLENKKVREEKKSGLEMLDED